MKKSIIKVGSETKVKGGRAHLLKENNKYSAWVQPVGTYNGKEYGKLDGWKRIKSGSLGDCRKAIKDCANKKYDDLEMVKSKNSKKSKKKSLRRCK